MTHSQTQGAAGAETMTAVQSLDLRDLHAANIARQAEWCPDQVPDLSFRGNELGGECGEAQNVIKKLERERQGWRGSRATKDDLADELADLVICADLCAVTAEIDLGAAVRRKFNATSEKQGLSVFLPLPALASPRADSVERTAGEVLKEACKPWEHYTGEPPDDGSPLSGVFVAGMVYTERLLAKLLDVTHYEGGDGSEDFDSDATQTLRNILAGAGLWDKDENTAADIQDLREEVAYWRADLAARLWSLRALYTTARARGKSGRAIDLGNLIRAALHSFRDAEASEWHDRCEICGEFILPGEAQASDDEISGHARCLTEDGVGYIHSHGREDLAEQVKKSEALLGEPWTFAPGTVDLVTPAQPAGAVPDSLRAAFEAAELHECWVNGDTADVMTNPYGHCGNFDQIVARCATGDLWRKRAVAIAESLNFVRSLLASHPAGQSAGSGAGTDALVDRFALALKAKLRAAEAKYGWQSGWLKTNWQAECQQGLVRHVGKGDPLDVAAYAAFCWYHGWPTTSRRSTELVTGAVIPTAGAIAAYAARYPDGSLQESSDNAIERWNRVAVAACLAEMPAPDSTRTGDEGTEEAVTKAAERAVEQLENAASGGLFHCEADREEAVEIITEALWSSPLAARPEAPSDAGWRETFETIAQWCEDTFGPITPERIVSRAGEEMDELLAEPTRVEEAADVLICLARYPGLWAAVERKMKVNRGRKWRLMGDGTGYHIKPTPPSDPAPSGQAEG